MPADIYTVTCSTVLKNLNYLQPLLRVNHTIYSYMWCRLSDMIHIMISVEVWIMSLVYVWVASTYLVVCWACPTCP